MHDATDDQRRADDGRLDSLLERLCDRLITPQELAELNERLIADGAARRLYLRYVQLHSSLAMAAGCNIADSGGAAARLERKAGAGDACERLLESIFDDGGAALRAPGNWGPRVWVAAALAVAAAILVAAFSPGLWRAGSQSTNSQNTVQRDAPPRVPALDVAPPQPAPVARVTYLSANVKWRDANESVSLRSTLETGQTLELVQGEIRLTYTSGVELKLLAPAEFVVRADGGSLRRGGLRAIVTEAGRGFTIDTPNGKVVDLGTEFGVAVDDFGVAEVSVFQGIVDAFPAANGGAAAKPIRLTKGQAVLWNRDTLIHMDADPLRFESPRDEAPAAAQAGVLLLDEDLRGRGLTSGEWTTRGAVTASPTGLKFTGDGSHANLPHLISTAQFDPSGGPVTVVCELRFAAVDSAAPPSFAVLTRSAAERSDDARELWNTMHTCVRCSLKSQDATLSGAVEAATKLDRECPLSNILWRGFHRIEEDVPYRLVMTDDGVNVSFTVSLVADPEIRKSITCRSLFRAKQNHIVLEGSPGGGVVIERIQVFQAPGRESISVDSSARLARNEESAATQSQRDVDARLLDELAPRDGALVIAEDFSKAELDRQIWHTLGDVAIVDGRLQLGVPNADEHINTWANRPYLLTKRNFAPAEGRLTILGTIDFAKNFLHEYGGSYAVMTRADSKLGSGPGWEYSVLQSGVRANFWPAAWGHEHSLEIHEKPSPSILSLLVAEGLEINPEARAYAFMVVDDGQRVTLTIVDRVDQSIRKTVSAATQPTLERGIIGFESCWGCPVWLDNVRVYASPAAAASVETSP